MGEEKKTQSAATAADPKKSKPRSPGYPGIALDVALDKIRDVHKSIGKHEANEASVYKALGYKGRSGASAVILAAIRAFGLADSTNGNVKVSNLALRILLDNREDTTEKRAAIREAALKPAMHQYMLEKYGEIDELPADSVMEYHLVFDKGFTEPGAKQFIEQYKATMAFVGGAPDGNMPSDGQDDQGRETQMELNTTNLNAGKTPPPSPGMREVPIPIAGAAWPSIKAPFPMTEAAWGQMIAVLTAMKPGLVADPIEKHSLLNFVDPPPPPHTK